MSDEYKCPSPEYLLTWLDGETEDELTAGHISRCPACQDFIIAVQQENELLRAMLDDIPAPDLTNRVTAGIEEAAGGTASLLNIMSYLVTAGVGFTLVLAYSFLPGLINFELRPVEVVKVLSGVDRLAMFIAETMELIADGIFKGDPLIPPLIFILAMLLINLIGKRRLSDV